MASATSPQHPTAFIPRDHLACAFVATRTTPPPLLDPAAQVALRDRVQSLAPQHKTKPFLPS